MSKDFRFNLLEILDMCQKIEDNGERFYREAAKIHSKHSEFLLGLAEQEMGHKVLFKSMRDDIESKEDAFISDPDGIIKSHLDAIANGLIFDIEAKDSGFSSDNISEVMDAAIEREEETILFFKETKKLLNSDKDKSVIENLIKEEMTHIDWINEQREKLPKGHPLI